MASRILKLAPALLCILLGALLGVGAFTFVYARGASYLSNDPKTCVNCHIMRDEYDGWHKATHHACATCNDCHVPHDFVGKWLTKASNGYHHSRAFTFQDFHEPIRIKPANARVLEANCIACHGELVEQITAMGALGASADPSVGPDLYGCVRCHQEVGHGPTQ
jgi:cytochrome c nitrite reductase small subunit